MPAKKAAKRDDTTKAADLDAMQRSIANGERIKRCEDALVDLTRAILVMTGVAGTDDRA